ncbi:hypothetical protein [Glutamicibacter creatinolyticus]|uniref:hypothetical protein n=1 Tax=Glutamicibacter creatinolyticus TaxID=162496 RepID=UPI003CCC8C68
MARHLTLAQLPRIGFSVRGQSLSGPRTRIEFVTAGLLLRRLLADPDLASVGAVIVDEVHERSIETDLVLAMLNQVNQLRDDLALLVMSATLHAEDLRGSSFPPRSPNPPSRCRGCTWWWTPGTPGNRGGTRCAG